jgi:hypothetical protein
MVKHWITTTIYIQKKIEKIGIGLSPYGEKNSLFNTHIYCRLERIWAHYRDIYLEYAIRIRGLHLAGIGVAIERDIAPIFFVTTASSRETNAILDDPKLDPIPRGAGNFVGEVVDISPFSTARIIGSEVG